MKDYGIYNLSDNALRLMPITFRGQHIEPPKSEDYQRGLREITTVKLSLILVVKNNPYLRFVGIYR